MATAGHPPGALYKTSIVRTTGFFTTIQHHVAGELQVVLNYLMPLHTHTLCVGRLVEIMRLKLTPYLPDPATPVYHFEFKAQAGCISFNIISTEYGLIELQAARNEPKSLLKLSLNAVASTVQSVDDLAVFQHYVPSMIVQKIATTYYSLLEYKPYRKRVGSGLSLR